MLIYEKNNKLNINFDNEVSEQPNVQIGKDEISLDGATISKDSVLPTPNVEEDVGKTIVVSEDGKYELAEASNPLPVPVLPQDVGKAIMVGVTGAYELGKAGGSDVETVRVYLPYSRIANIPTTGTITGYKDKNQTKFTSSDFSRLYSAIKSNSVRFIIMLANEMTSDANMIFPIDATATDGAYNKSMGVSFIQVDNSTLVRRYVSIYAWES